MILLHNTFTTWNTYSLCYKDFPVVRMFYTIILKITTTNITTAFIREFSLCMESYQSLSNKHLLQFIFLFYHYQNFYF